MEICQVVRKFSRYNVGEKLVGTPDQVSRWVNQGVAVRVPANVPVPEAEAKAPEAPPAHKMVSVSDEAKGDDSETGPSVPRRGRPSR